MIEDVQLEHEGEYTCMATNVGGTATHITELDVQGKSKLSLYSLFQILIQAKPNFIV